MFPPRSGRRDWGICLRHPTFCWEKTGEKPWNFRNINPLQISRKMRLMWRQVETCTWKRQKIINLGWCLVRGIIPRYYALCHVKISWESRIYGGTETPSPYFVNSQPSNPRLHGVHHGPIAANLNSLNGTLGIWDWPFQKKTNDPKVIHHYLSWQPGSFPSDSELPLWLTQYQYQLSSTSPATNSHQWHHSIVDVTISPCHDTMKLRHVWGPSNGTGGLAADLMWFSGQIGRILHFQTPFEESLVLLGSECISHYPLVMSK